MMHISMYKNYTGHRRYRGNFNDEIIEGANIEYIFFSQYNFWKIIEMYGVNFRDIELDAALIWVCKNNNIAIEWLLKIEGVDVNVQDENKTTPLIYSSMMGNTEIVKLLLKAENINVNIQDVDGRTALKWACLHGCVEIVKLLLKVKDIDVNIRDDDGQSDLMAACYLKRSEIVELLLEMKDVDLDLHLDLHGEDDTMVQTWAYKNNNMEIVHLLAEMRREDKRLKFK